jgi:putative ABC transport system permease protein
VETDRMLHARGLPTEDRQAWSNGHIPDPKEELSMNGIRLDLRSAFRTLIRAPWFTSLAILTLALGIGLNTALFSLVDAVLIRALPFKEPHRLVEIWGRDQARTGMRVPGPFVDAVRARSRTLQSIAIHGPVGGILRTNDGPTDIRGDHVSANFVEVLGISPLMGRGFRPDEDQPGTPPVMLVSHNFWQRHLGGDPAAVGRALYFDDLAYTVIGVMPPEFRTQFRDGVSQDYWTTQVDEQLRQFELEEGYELVARLAPDATLEDAQRELQTISATVVLEGWGGQGRRLGMLPLKNDVVGDSARALKLMQAAVAIVLVIVCANLAVLLLARSDRRVTEFATRKAIGARIGQLFRLTLIESLLLAGAGGVVGVTLAYATLPVILALAPADIPRIAESAINWRALNVALVLTLLTGITFGFAPALRLSRLSLLEAMKRASGRVSSQNAWLRSMLVTGQVAASITLCVLAGLVGRTFLTLLPSNPGFESTSLLVFSLYLPTPLYPKPEDRSRVSGELLRRVQTVPGVTAAGWAENIPFSSTALGVPLLEMRSGTPDSTGITVDARGISPNYHELLHIPLKQGRLFTAADRENSPGVAIVNQTLARRLGGAVLGRTVRIGRRPATFEIVGVVADARSTGENAEILNEIYVPYQQRASNFGFLVIQSPLGAGQLTPHLRRQIRLAAPELPLMDTKSAQALTDLVRQSLAGPRFSATLASAFSAISMLLAAMGVFGLVSYAVAQRKHEFGIRIAIGARPSQLVAIATRSAIALTLVGVTSGLLIASYFTRFVENQLYAVAPLDRPTFIGAALLMLVVAGLAAGIPARRVLRTNPMTALRHE